MQKSKLFIRYRYIEQRFCKYCKYLMSFDVMCIWRTQFQSLYLWWYYKPPLCRWFCRGLPVWWYYHLRSQHCVNMYFHWYGNYYIWTVYKTFFFSKRFGFSTPEIDNLSSMLQNFSEIRVIDALQLRTISGLFFF